MPSAAEPGPSKALSQQQGTLKKDVSHETALRASGYPGVQVTPCLQDLSSYLK